jgi:acylglycerol lipase
MSETTSAPTAALRSAPDPDWIETAGGHRIPVRRYGADGTRRPVVMLHGLQSHSGWFVQSASRVAKSGFPVHAFDRCGSGVSLEDCDGGARLAGVLDEIDAVADAALEGRGQASFHLLGHCFGAIPALLYAALYRPERVASLALATPALYTHTSIRARDRIRVLWSVLTHRPVQVTVPLQPEQFSELEPFIEFIRGDPLARKRFPARFLYEIRRARALLPHAVRALRAPTFVAIADDDPICDNDRNRRLLERVTASVELHEYPGARHILEFSGRREEFLEHLVGWFERQEVV